MYKIYFLAILLVGFSLQHQAETWTHPNSISRGISDDIFDYTELITDSSGRVHAFWDGGSKDRALAQIYYSFLDPGKQWAEPLDILTKGRFSTVRLDSQGWLHLFASNSDCLTHSTSLVSEAYNALPWINSQRCIAPSQITQFDVFKDKEDGFHLVYSEPGGTAIGYQSSIDGGMTWSLSTVIAPAQRINELLTETAVVVDGNGRIHAAWVKYLKPEAFPPLGVWYAYSDDGKSWSAPQQIAEDYNLQPQLLVADDSTIHIIWNGALLRSERYHRFSTTNGEEWSPTQAWVSVPGGILGHPDAVLDSNNQLHSVAATDDGLWYASFDGIEWSPAIQLGSDEEQTGNPSIAIALNNQLHVIFGSRASTIQHTQLTLKGLPQTAIQPIPTKILDQVTAYTTTMAQNQTASILTPNPQIDDLPRDQIDSTPSRSLQAALVGSLIVIFIVVGRQLFLASRST